MWFLILTHITHFHSLLPFLESSNPIKPDVLSFLSISNGKKMGPSLKWSQRG